MIVVAVIALLNTVVSLYYYIKVLRNLYLIRPEKEAAVVPISPSAFTMLIVLLVPIFLFGIYFTPLVDFAKNSIALMGF